VSTLWLVATPIGNMADLAPRAVEILSSVALVCCEDSRRTGLLLQRAGVRAARLAVCNEHTERSCTADVLAVLDGGGDVAVVSDAGSPGISDPGESMVRAVLDGGHAVSAVPGPTAAIMALTTSGLPAGRFVFEGFLPRKGRERSARLAEIAAERRTTVLYEAPHRVARTIDDLRAACGDDRAVVVARELTKLHEEVLRGRLGDIDLGAPRGEYVLVLAGAAEPATATDDVVTAQLRAALAAGASTRDAADEVSARTGRRRREVYDLALALDHAEPAAPAQPETIENGNGPAAGRADVPGDAPRDGSADGPADRAGR
jgi:16S rRNA (cytidine1402-2'-O)-methyltransferase